MVVVPGVVTVGVMDVVTVVVGTVVVVVVPVVVDVVVVVVPVVLPVVLVVVVSVLEALPGMAEAENTPSPTRATSENVVSVRFT